MTANARASTHDLAPRGWACGDASAETSPQHRPPPHGRRRQRRERCTQDALELAAHKGGLRLLLGVLSAPTPGSRETRDVIRKTWLTAATREIQACFVIGSVGVADLASLDSEADHLGDLHFVQAREGVLRTSKVFLWFLAAARVALVMQVSNTLEWVGRVDEDTFVHLPSLSAELDRYRCAPYVCYGAMAFTSLDPQYPNRCRLSWRVTGNEGKQVEMHPILVQRGCQPLFPFPLGALQVLSAPTLRQLASTRGLHDYMNLTDRRQDAINKTLYPRALANEIEDHAVGYWLAVAQRENSRFRIRYVNAEPGSVRLVHNRPVHACTPGPNGIFDGDGSNSWRQVVAIHPLKEACGLAYVWQQLIMAQPTRLRRGGGASNGDRKKAVDEGRRRSRTAAPLINTTITLPHENTPLEVCRFHLRGLCTISTVDLAALVAYVGSYIGVQ